MKRAVLALAVLLALTASVDVFGERLGQKMRLWAWRTMPAAFGATGVTETMVVAADGVRLATDVYLPDEPGPHPAILIRLPYGKRQFEEVDYWLRVFGPRGYAVVAQDMRGRYASEGVFTPYAAERADAVTTLDWIVSQEWSDGRVGTIGCSALGETQVLLAAERHPAHRAMVALGAGGAAGALEQRNTFFGAFEGGIFNLASGFGWFSAAGGKTSDKMEGAAVDYAAALVGLPLIEMVQKVRSDPTDWEDFLRRFTDMSYWKAAGYIDDSDSFATPGLMVDTWYDPSLGGSFALAKTMRKGAPQSLIIAPGTHCNYSGAAGTGHVGDMSVGPEAMLPFETIFADYMAHWLKDGPARDMPNYLYYMLGEDRWHEAANWPPEGAMQQSFLLTSGGAAQSDKGNGQLVTRETAPGQDSITSDPADPVPTVGGAICCTGELDEEAGPKIQSVVDARDDVLVYTAPVAERDLRIAGPLSAHLYVSVDTPDADVIARLSDVAPDGTALMIQEGALRLRYRDGFDKARPMKAGEIAQVTVDMRHIAYMLRAGHRLRLTLAGSSFPRLERNLNTGGANYDEVKGRPARLTVHTGTGTASALTTFVLME